jgi:molybdenum-dependent DNA-binding transcriptional regulator ModE
MKQMRPRYKQRMANLPEPMPSEARLARQAIRQAERQGQIEQAHKLKLAEQERQRAHQEAHWQAYELQRAERERQRAERLRERNARQDAKRRERDAEAKRAIEVRGICYNGVSAACRAYRIQRSHVSVRMKSMGLSAARAIEMLIEHPFIDRRGVSSGIATIVLGTEYPTIKAAIKAHNLKENTVWVRMKRKNESAAQAIEHLIKRPTDRRGGVGVVTTVHGVPHKSISAACKAHGVNQSSVWLHMKREGGTASQAIEALIERPPGRKERVGVSTTVLGVRYISTTAACRAHGVSYHSVRQRMRQQNENIEQAIRMLIVRRRAAGK